jgi:hypothetical protein
MRPRRPGYRQMRADAARLLFIDLELESPALYLARSEGMRPSPLAIRASACWNSGFRKTFGYPRQAPY